MGQLWRLLPREEWGRSRLGTPAPLARGLPTALQGGYERGQKPRSRV